VPVLVVATGNPGKLAEFRAFLTPAGYEVSDLSSISDATPVEETGSTFEENARLKAEGYSLRTSHLVLADDSGLEVDALGGAPGVHSARYGGPELSDQERCTRLLEKMSDVPEPRRTARFRCLLALARAGKTVATFEGRVEGVLLRAPRGDGGFGYDPIFFHPPSGRAFAELTRAEKERVSHRGQALRKLVEDGSLYLSRT
jgi:XTP/dITP diphosphohydrolase